MAAICCGVGCPPWGGTAAMTKKWDKEDESDWQKGVSGGLLSRESFAKMPVKGHEHHGDR